MLIQFKDQPRLLHSDMWQQDRTYRNRIIIKGLQEVQKSTWGMPRLSEAKKDVASCEKPRIGANSRLKRGFPNGITHPEKSGYSL